MPRSQEALIFWAIVLHKDAQETFQLKSKKNKAETGLLFSGHALSCFHESLEAR
jgi:hypothetical protein